MAKYRDTKKSRHQADIKYIPGEDAATRHERRLAFNLKKEDDARVEFIQLGFDVDINNFGQHWIFRKKGFIAEWWPSSAKLVINKKWERGIHCHDYNQVLKEISK